jgi:hypoxanthine phosphoribosyltransferase
MKKLVLDNNQVKQLISRICRDIAGSQWRPDYVVGITRGGLIPAVMISQWFNCRMETLNVSLRDHEGHGPESNLWMAEEAFGYHRTDLPTKPESNPSLRKNILIVDDINDSGATFNWILDDWPGGCLPNHAAWKDIWNNNVKFAVLIDNQASKCGVKMDFCGREINKAEDDVWVDFPWEDWWSK